MNILESSKIGKLTYSYNKFISAIDSLKNDLCLEELLKKTNNINELFIYICENDKLIVAKSLYYISILSNKPNRIDIHFNDEYIFRKACNDGNEDLAKWLYSIQDNDIINIHANNANNKQSAVHDRIVLWTRILLVRPHVCACA